MIKPFSSSNVNFMGRTSISIKKEIEKTNNEDFDSDLLKNLSERIKKGEVQVGKEFSEGNWQAYKLKAGNKDIKFSYLPSGPREIKHLCLDIDEKQEEDEKSSGLRRITSTETSTSISTLLKDNSPKVIEGFLNLLTTLKSLKDKN